MADFWYDPHRAKRMFLVGIIVGLIVATAINQYYLQRDYIKKTV